MAVFKLLLVVALKPEWALVRAFTPCSLLPGEINLYALKKFPHAALLQTGAGSESCARNLAGFFEKHKAHAICHFGSCGALRSGLKNGDIFVVTSICDGQGCIELEPATTAPWLMQASPGVRPQTARLFTSSCVLKNEIEKKTAAQNTGADIVDMESYPAAKICREKNIPYTALRAVFDELSDDLTDLGNPCNQRGDVSAIRLAANILRQPRLILELPDLKKKADRVGAALSPLVLKALRQSSG